MNGGQISPWTQLPKSKPSALQFHGLDTDKARRAILRLKKVDWWVERWAQLEISLSSASHLAQLAISGVQVDDVDPTITIDITGDTFLSEAAAENAANWTLDAATSGLTFGAINYVGASQVTIATTGTALAGLFAIQAKATCLTGGVLSGVATYDIDTETSTCTDPLVDPILAVELSLDTIKSEVLIEDAANWTFVLGTSGLTIASITYVDATHCTIETTGVAAETTITAMIEKAALTLGKYDSGVATYNLGTDASTCTVAPEVFVKVPIATASEDPTLRIVLNDNAFASKADCEEITNWTVDEGTTGLTFASVTYVNERTADLVFEGTAAAGTIAIDIGVDALVFVTTPSVSTDIDATAWASTYASSDIAGTVHAYQWFPRSDVEGYVGTYTPPQDKNHHPYSHIDLVGDGDFSPRLASAFYYEPGSGEGTDYTIWAQLLLDLG